ncbi:LOW QUALITY PROTEIN: endoglucanase A, partial [Streptomyces sp. e14]
RPYVGHVLQRGAELLGLRQVLGEVRRRHPAHHSPDLPAAQQPHPAAEHPVQDGLEREHRVHRGQRGVVQRPQLEGQVVDPERDARRLAVGSVGGRGRLL